MSLYLIQRLEQWKKERDAFRNAKLGITEVMLDLQIKTNSLVPDPALQKLIDFADRRILVSTVEILWLEYKISQLEHLHL